MKITDVFPALLEKHAPGTRRSLSWTRRGPGRRHNTLTKRQQDAKDLAMRDGGMNATKAIEFAKKF